MVHIRDRSSGRFIISLIVLALSIWFVYYFVYFVETNTEMMMGLLIYLGSLLLIPVFQVMFNFIVGKIAGFKVIEVGLFGQSYVWIEDKFAKKSRKPQRKFLSIQFGGKKNPVFIFLGGVLFIILGIVGFALGFFLCKNAFLKSFFMALLVPFVIYFLNEIFPLGGLRKTDGKHLLDLLFNRNYRRLFTQRLETNLDLCLGKRYKDFEFQPIDFSDDILYYAYLMDQANHYLDSDDMEHYIETLEKLENCDSVQPIFNAERNFILAEGYALFCHDMFSFKKFWNQINQNALYGPYPLGPDGEYLNYCFNLNQKNICFEKKEMLIKIMELTPYKGNRIIMQRKLNMMHPIEYHLSFAESINSDLKYAYVFFKRIKLFLLDLTMREDAFVENMEENGFVYGAFNGELTMQTSYGLLSAKRVIYAGAFFTAEEFANRFDIVGTVLK